MVGVGVCVEDSIHVPDLFAQGLTAKVRAGVDNDRLLGSVILPLDGNGRAAALIVRVV